MILKKVIVKTTSDGSDLVSSILIDNGCNGTTIVDKNDVFHATRNESLSAELTAFYPPHVLVVGIIEHDDPNASIESIKADLEILKQKNKNLGALTTRIEEVNSEHWADIWQDYYKPYTIGKIKVYGTWQRQSGSLFKIPVVLNPGVAFGTGQHPTTELVIMHMQRFNLKDKIVLDLGCGSGILGLCALKLGAQHAYLVDIDNVAIDSTTLNAKTNKLENKLTILNEDIVYNKNTNIKADFIFCNINSQIDLDYAKNINNNINNNGIVILSGIRSDYRSTIKDEYIKQGFEILNEHTLSDWFSLILRKI